jgi:hypothetical protein
MSTRKSSDPVTEDEVALGCGCGLVVLGVVFVVLCACVAVGWRLLQWGGIVS